MFSFKNIKYYYNHTIREIKNFIIGDNSTRFLIFLFFFVISLGFWLLQTLKDDYETELSIPVRLRKVPNDVVLTRELPAQVNVTVRDKGTVLLNYMLAKTFYPVIIDFEEYDTGTDYVKIPRSEYQQVILAQLNAGTRLISVEPDTLELVYSRGNPKTIPVKLQGRITAGRLNYVSDTIFTPDSVVVYAPDPILDTITAAYTERVTLLNIADTVKRYVSLEPINGAKFIPDHVALTLATDIFTEKMVEVPIIGVNFPPDKALRTFPSKAQVTFRLGLNNFKEVNAGDFILTVSYEELIHSESDKFRLQLKTVPRGVSDVRIVPDMIDFLIEERQQHD